ncbi:peptide N-acetyl-beta-D-glucosaminyl asparaginase amidase A-domain-containing protein [Xylariales sp. PMI_506]|nr:peptide N-acetyl-beta-D-glucosaminyl asparaginase amidase A-domain-containing protein [Xylariales sp. PMI_506]
MEHSFANSYGAPFVGNYTPPSNCDFNHVTLNFTVEIAGRQYDRWGSMYLGDIEVFSTSTAEPTPTGIRWTYLKDMTHYLSLWKESQTVIFELDNIVDDTYTGILNTTLTLTFFTSPIETGDHLPADLILPISAEKGSSGEASYWTVPGDNATSTIDFPRNVNRAVIAVSVKAQGDEEQWFGNLPQSAIDTFDPNYGTYPGYSPWRELQVFVDGQLAGVHWPFPVIFTGGVVPQLNRPIVGLEAFDLQDHEIDITPWLPILCDGNPHNISMNMVGLDDDGISRAWVSSTVDANWYIVGKVFLWLDEDESSITTGTISTIYESDPAIDFSLSIFQNATGFNESLNYDYQVSRNFSVSSLVSSQKNNGTATWSQTLSYFNQGHVYEYGWGEINNAQTTGLDTAKSQGVFYSTSYNYPIVCNSTINETAAGNLTLWAHLYQALNLKVQGDAVTPTGLEAFQQHFDSQGIDFVGSVINTDREGTANYSRYADNTVTSGIGYTNQVFYFGGLTGGGGGSYEVPGTELYFRNITAYNNSIIADHEFVAR